MCIIDGANGMAAPAAQLNRMGTVRQMQKINILLLLTLIIVIVLQTQCLLCYSIMGDINGLNFVVLCYVYAAINHLAQPQLRHLILQHEDSCPYI